MGIWKQRIDESWLQGSNFNVINVRGGSSDMSSVTAISLKHIKIDSTTLNANPRFLTSTPNPFTTAELDGLMVGGIGINTTTNTLMGTSSTIYSYILDYFFGPLTDWILR